MLSISAYVIYSDLAQYCNTQSYMITYPEVQFSRMKHNKVFTKYMERSPVMVDMECCLMIVFHQSTSLRVKVF